MNPSVKKNLVVRHLQKSILNIMVRLCVLGTILGLSLVPVTVQAQASKPVVIAPPGKEVNWFNTVEQVDNNVLMCYDGGTWHQIGPAYSDPAVAVRSNGTVEVVVQGYGNSLVEYYGTRCGSSWTGPHPIDSTAVAASAPAIFARTGGAEVDIVTVDQYQQLRYYFGYSPGSWSPATLIGGRGTAFSTPALYVQTNQTADIVFQGPGNSLLYYWAIPGSGWTEGTIVQPGGNGAFSTPAIINIALGIFDVVVEGPSNTLYEYTWNPLTQLWVRKPIGNSVASAPAATLRSANPAGEADVVVPGFGTTLWYFYRPAHQNWSSPYPVPITAAPGSAASIAVEADGNAHLAYNDVYGHTYDCSATPGYPWQCAGPF